MQPYTMRPAMTPLFGTFAARVKPPDGPHALSFDPCSNLGRALTPVTEQGAGAHSSISSPYGTISTPPCPT